MSRETQAEIGRVALPIIGAVIGGFIGQAAGASIGGAIGSAAAYALWPPEIPAPKLPKLQPNDVVITGYDQRNPVPYLLGEYWISPEIVGFKQIRAVAIKKKIKTGKHKSKKYVTGYQYYFSGALGLIRTMQGSCSILEMQRDFISFDIGQVGDGDSIAKTSLNAYQQQVNEAYQQWLQAWQQWEASNPGWSGVPYGYSEYHDWLQDKPAPFVMPKMPTALAFEYYTTINPIKDTYPNLDVGAVGRDLLWTVYDDVYIGDNLYYLPNFRAYCKRSVPTFLPFDFWSLPIPANNNQKNCFITVITSGVFCYNVNEIWHMIGGADKMWEPINSLSYNIWPVRRKVSAQIPEDANPASKTDFYKAIEEFETYVGSDNIVGYTFHVPWYWNTSDDSFKPLNATLPSNASGTPQIMCYKKPANVTVSSSFPLTSSDTGQPLSAQLYNPTLGGVQMYDPTTFAPICDLMPDKDGVPIFGGTPDDAGLIEGIKHVVDLGKKFIFYSFCEVVDPPDLQKPWRGNLLPTNDYLGVGDPIKSLLTQIKNQCVFYANLLVNNGVKPYAFITCSEMKKINQQKTYVPSATAVPYAGTTIYQDSNGYFYFTAIPLWLEIYDAVKTIFNNAGWTDVKVGYSADWSEMNGFKDDLGYWWRPLDDVFVHQDFVFVDAYWGITERNSYKYDDYKNGWTQGRDWDYYITDYDLWKNYQGGTAPITDKQYASKDLKYWLENYHHNINPDGTINSTTAWVPNSKKIFFTECGCPSIDSGATEPNLFYDPDAIQGGISRGSTLTPNIYVQWLYYKALANNANDGTLPICGYSIWQGDSRPLSTLLTTGLYFWGDAYRVPYVHWIKYFATTNSVCDVFLDYYFHDFITMRGIQLACDVTSILIAGMKLQAKGFLANVLIKDDITLEQFLAVANTQYPVLFYREEGLLKARFLDQDDFDGVIYDVQDYPIDIVFDSSQNACWIAQPFERIVYNGKTYYISNPELYPRWISWWTLGGGTFNVTASNVIANSLEFDDVTPFNIRVSVNFFDTSEKRSSSAYYEFKIQEGLMWNNVADVEIFAPNSDVAQLQCRYLAARALYVNNTCSFATYKDFHVGDRIRVITNTRDTFYRIIEKAIDSDGIFHYKAYHEPQMFHNMIYETANVDVPQLPTPKLPELQDMVVGIGAGKLLFAGQADPQAATPALVVDYPDGDEDVIDATENALKASVNFKAGIQYRQPFVNGDLYGITNGFEIVMIKQGVYGSYVIRSFNGSKTADATELYMTTDQFSEYIPTKFDIPLDLSAYAYSVGYDSAETDLGEHWIFEIGGKIYKRGNNWIVTAVIDNIGAGGYAAGQIPNIDWSNFKFIIDGTTYTNVKEVVLTTEPTDVQIWYYDKVWRNK